MSAAPKISVVMTVFNGGVFLATAIASVLAQTLEDFEFVIVDDASTDGSVEVARRYAEDDARIRLICCETNKGQTACLNQAIGEARGGWIARQDADDVSLPERLARQWSVVEESDDVVLVGTNGWIIDERGAVTGMIHVPLEGSEIRSSLPFRNPFIHTSVMFRRTLADGSLVRYDERFRICQDWDLWVRLLRSGRGVNLADRLVAYRHLDDSLSRGAGEETRRESAEIVAAVWKELFPAVPFNAELLREFREGGMCSDRRRFWKLHGRCVEGQARAVHRVQAAGALLSRDVRAGLVEIFAATAAAPWWTVGVLWKSLAIQLGLVPGFTSEVFDQKTGSLAG